ncbi:hypothetical protein LXL04_006530 [Taraxacum kok-saghyz]
MFVSAASGSHMIVDVSHSDRLMVEAEARNMQENLNCLIHDQDGVYGTNCPIPPGQNFTYNLQVKDQIGDFTILAGDWFKQSHTPPGKKIGKIHCEFCFWILAYLRAFGIASFWL